jgi:hypothetical protein
MLAEGLTKKGDSGKVRKIDTRAYPYTVTPGHQLQTNIGWGCSVFSEIDKILSIEQRGALLLFKYKPPAAQSKVI